MVPSTWLTVLFYTLLVAPGLFYDLLATRRRVQVPESTFREISRVVLASLVISVLSFSVLAAVRALKPSWMPDPGKVISSPHEYFLTHYRLILRTLIIEGAIALAMAWLVQSLRYWRTRVHLRYISTWTKVLREECPRGHVPYVQVRISNGMTYVGRVGYFTHDLESSERELVLTPPLFVKKPEETLKSMPPVWQRVVLSGDCIQSLAVQYDTNPNESEPKPPGAMRRLLTDLSNKLPHVLRIWEHEPPTEAAGRVASLIATRRVPRA